MKDLKAFNGISKRQKEVSKAKNLLPSFAEIYRAKGGTTIIEEDYYVDAVMDSMVFFMGGFENNPDFAKDYKKDYFFPHLCYPKIEPLSGVTEELSKEDELKYKCYQEAYRVHRVFNRLHSRKK